MRVGVRARCLALALAFACGATGAARADSIGDEVSNYFTSWFDRVDQAQASQPHWMTPIVTVTPRLEEEYRYDQFWQTTNNGASLDNYGGGKGLELIPTTTNEIIIGQPPYIVRNGNEEHNGFGDWPFLLIKQRLLSANEQDGNYIVTAFLQGVAPLGAKGFSTNSYEINPTLAFGKGWGDFDIQATIGGSFPIAYENKIGVQVPMNISFQYWLRPYFWPEFEVQNIYFVDGPHGGKNQVLLTPGIMFGRFRLYDRLKLSFGIGYQIAVAPPETRVATLPLYRNSPIFTVRFSF